MRELAGVWPESRRSFPRRRKKKRKDGGLAQIFKSEGKTSYPLFITLLYITHSRYRPEKVAENRLGSHGFRQRHAGADSNLNHLP